MSPESDLHHLALGVASPRLAPPCDGSARRAASTAAALSSWRDASCSRERALGTPLAPLVGGTAQCGGCRSEGMAHTWLPGEPGDDELESLFAATREAWRGGAHGYEQWRPRAGAEASRSAH